MFLSTMTYLELSCNRRNFRWSPACTFCRKSETCSAVRCIFYCRYNNNNIILYNIITRSRSHRLDLFLVRVVGRLLLRTCKGTACIYSLGRILHRRRRVYRPVGGGGGGGSGGGGPYTHYTILYGDQKM